MLHFEFKSKGHGSRWKQMKTGSNKDVAGVTKLVTDDSSFIILFYFVLIISIYRYDFNKTRKGKSCFRSLLQPR